MFDVVKESRKGEIKAGGAETGRMKGKPIKCQCYSAADVLG